MFGKEIYHTRSAHPPVIWGMPDETFERIPDNLCTFVFSPCMQKCIAIVFPFGGTQR